MATRGEDPRRFRDARSDARVGSIEKRIDRDYGLPAESVHIRNPDCRFSCASGSINELSPTTAEWVFVLLECLCGRLKAVEVAFNLLSKRLIVPNLDHLISRECFRAFPLIEMN